MKRKNNDMARHVHVRAVVAYPAFSVALVVSFALVLTSFGPSQITASAATNTPTPTATPSATTTTATPSATTTTAAPLAPPSTAGATPSPTALPSASSGGVTPGVPVDHHVLAWIPESRLVAQYLAVDAPLTDASQFQSIRIRFKLHNAGAAPITAAPQLEYRAEGSNSYAVVPEESRNGVPFRVDREWVANRALGGGTRQGPLGEDIAVAKFLTGNEGGGLAMIGHHSMGANPDRQITLPTDSYTEQEFTVRLTIDAKFLNGYEFRITNGRTVLAGSQVAKIHLGPPPAMQLSPGLHQGVAVGGPKPANRTGIVK